MIWQAVMSYAHQGIEIKPLAGLPPAAAPPTPARNQVAANQAQGTAPVLRPTLLTKRGTEALVRIEQLMDDASRKLAASGTAGVRTADRRRRDAAGVCIRGQWRGAVRGN